MATVRPLLMVSCRHTTSTLRRVAPWHQVSSSEVHSVKFDAWVLGPAHRDMADGEVMRR